MEGDDGEPALGLQQMLGGAQAACELEKFLIEVEAERLKGPCRRVLGLVVPAAEHASDDIGKLPVLVIGASARRARIARAIERARFSSPSVERMAARSRSGSALTRSLAVSPSPPMRMSRGSILGEGEAALRLIELHGGDAEIERDAIHCGDAFRSAISRISA